MDKMDSFFNRTRVRAQALQLLYQAQIRSLDVLDIIRDESFILEEGPLDPYAQHLVELCTQHMDELDERIEQVSTNWSLSRISLIDKTILNLALTEMFFVDEVHQNVVISEAVILAKAYSGEESPSFINGILGKIARDNDGATDELETEIADIQASKVLWFMSQLRYQSYSDLSSRLDAIVSEVKKRDTSLEASLQLLDEALELGSQAVDLIDKAPEDDEDKGKGSVKTEDMAVAPDKNVNKDGADKSANKDGANKSVSNDGADKGDANNKDEIESQHMSKGADKDGHNDEDAVVVLSKDDESQKASQRNVKKTQDKGLSQE